MSLEAIVILVIDPLAMCGAGVFGEEFAPE